jgi:alkylated DNA repair protein alkB family protein 4
MDDPVPLPEMLRERPSNPTERAAEGRRIHHFDLESQSAPGCPTFVGVLVLRDFVSPSESDRLLREIEQTPFAPAQSGKTKQHHGARVNFNKRKVNTTGFDGLPRYVHWIDTRLRRRVANHAGADTPEVRALRAALEGFEPTDAFVLRYRSSDASNLDLHLDDRFAYGDVILDLSLESDCVLTFVETDGGGEDSFEGNCIRVPLPARSLAILHGPARIDWEHGILAYDVAERRTSVTLRTLSETLRETDAGRQIARIARRNASDR